MGYTNSPLVSYVKLSPNHSGLRKHEIDTITIHCVVGQCSVETLGQIFLPESRQASCNYGIGYDGKIGLYVEEKNRSWCTSSSANDNRAITIEVASDKTSPYAINSAAYKSLVSLCADICKRNNIKKLVWSTDKNTRVNHLNGCNLTVHRDYANKSCPGDYIYNRMDQIASEVNKLIKGVETVTNKIEAGDTVEFVTGAKQWNGKDVPSGYINKVYTVKQVGSNGRAVLTIGDTVMYAVDVKYLREIVNEIVDTSTASSWAAKSWAKLLNKGAIDGSNPQDTCTMEKLAVVLDRLGILD